MIRYQTLAAALILITAIAFLLIVDEKQHAIIANQDVKISTLQQELSIAQIELSRDDVLIANLLKGWERSKPVFNKLVTITVYTSRTQETDSTPWTTASNKKVRPGTLAISRDLLSLIPYGTEVVLAGYGSFVVTDTMNKRYKNAVDIWSGDLKAAQLHGRKEGTLIWQ